MPALGSPTIIDGSHGEGGGALLRTALCMSVLTQQPLRVENVRGATTHPGLDYEDWLLIQTLAGCCGAETVGAEIGSPSVSFLPTRRPKGISGVLNEEPATPARSANALVIASSLLPVCARSGMYSQFQVKGETYGRNALGYDYFANVSLAALRKMGLYASVEQRESGFGRESWGDVAVEVEPSVIQGIEWADRGRLLKCKAIVTSAELPPAVGLRAVAHLEQLAKNAGVPMEAEAVRTQARTPGIYVTAWAEYQCGIGGATAMGARGLRAESLSQSVFESLMQWLATDATTDPFLVDQILLPAALAEGVSTFKTSLLTERFLTSVWVVKQFLPIHITVKGAEGKPGSVTIRR
jgi:RNA 3'-terminal phosphate cyclase (ATP)